MFVEAHALCDEEVKLASFFDLQQGSCAVMQDGVESSRKIGPLCGDSLIVRALMRFPSSALLLLRYRAVKPPTWHLSHLRRCPNKIFSSSLVSFPPIPVSLRFSSSPPSFLVCCSVQIFRFPKSKFRKPQIHDGGVLDTIRK